MPVMPVSGAVVMSHGGLAHDSGLSELDQVRPPLCTTIFAGFTAAYASPPQWKRALPITFGA